jgi:hypothetical protein
MTKPTLTLNGQAPTTAAPAATAPAPEVTAPAVTTPAADAPDAPAADAPVPERETPSLLGTRQRIVTKNGQPSLHLVLNEWFGADSRKTLVDDFTQAQLDAGKWLVSEE